jgi:hypothetical protein
VSPNVIREDLMRKWMLLVVACFAFGALAAEEKGVVTAPTSATTPTPATPANPLDDYLDIGIGGDFSLSDDTYGSRGSRFQAFAEFGGPHAAFPVSYSSADGFKIVGLKPRFHYMFSPIPALPNLWFGPGLGFVVNYWNQPYVGGTTHGIELGAQVGFFMRYNVIKYFNVIFTPMALDLNFWRKAFDEAGAASGTRSNSRFGAVYNIMVGAGLSF